MIAEDIGGDDGIFGVFEDAFERALSGGFHGGIDIGGGDFFAEDGDEVNDRAVGYGDAHGNAIDTALECGEDLAGSAGSACGGGDDVDGGSAGAISIFVRGIEDALVVGVGVDGRHHGVFDAEAFVEDFGHRCEAVGGARGVGDQLVFGFEVVIVDTEDDGGVDRIFGGDGEQDFGGTGFEVFFEFGAAAEDARRFDDKVQVERFPRKVGQFAFCNHLNGAFAFDVQDVSFEVDALGEAAHHRVVLEQMNKCLRLADIVDGDDFDIVVFVQDVAENCTTNATETVDSNTNCHDITSCWVETCGGRSDERVRTRRAH